MFAAYVCEVFVQAEGTVFCSSFSNMGVWGKNVVKFEGKEYESILL